MPLFESYDRRINQINVVLNKYGIKDIEEARTICKEKALIHMKSQKEFNQSLLKTLVGLTL